MTYRCPRCQDTGVVWQGSGEPDDAREEAACPTCGPNATEEPEWSEVDAGAEAGRPGGGVREGKVNAAEITCAAEYWAALQRRDDLPRDRDTTAERAALTQLIEQYEAGGHPECYEAHGMKPGDLEWNEQYEEWAEEAERDQMPAYPLPRSIVRMSNDGDETAKGGR